MAYDNELRGALFRNGSQRDGKSDPQYRGRITIAGVEYWLDAWLATSKAGDRYMQLKARPKDADRQQPQPQPQRQAPAPAPAAAAAKPAPSQPDPFDDEIPF
jgi:hypothetical protein